MRQASVEVRPPVVGDGLEGFGAFVAELAADSKSMVYKYSHKVLAQGNFVVAYSLAQIGDEDFAVFDLFRLQDGLIVEHWDATAPLPLVRRWSTKASSRRPSSGGGVRQSSMALTTMPQIATLNLATLRLPENHPEAVHDTACSVYGYAIDHPDGTILFDTGVGIGNDVIDELYTPQVHELGAELAAHGFSTDAVTAIVNSHLHFDHCGQNPRFYGSNIPVFVQRAEVDNVNGDAFYTDATWALAPESQRRCLDGDVEIAEGVTIIATPGHTEGHQSLLLEAAGERVVIAGQAVWNSVEYVDEVATPSNAGSDELRGDALESIRRIKSLRPSVVFFSHCAEHRSA